MDLLEACSSMFLVSLMVFLVSVILSSAISLTGGMVMCFSSSQVSICTFKRMYWSCFLLVASLAEPSAVFAIHLTNVVNIVVSLYSSLFTKKTSVTGQQLALWLLTDLLFSLFGGSYITPFRWILLFQNNSAVIHKVALCVIPMQIRYILIYFIYHIGTGPLHMFQLFSSWIFMPCHKVTSHKSQSQFLTSKKLAHCSVQSTINSKHPSQNSQ